MREGIIKTMPFRSDDTVDASSDASDRIGPLEASGDLDGLVASDYERIRRLAWRFGVPPHDLDDAAQEIFVLAWSGRHSYHGESAVSTWLTRIAINYLTSRRRKLARRLRLARDHQPEPLRLYTPPRFEESESHATQCIQRLPTKLRSAFVLRYLEEMPVAEVAAILKIPEGTVRSRLYHARLQLREMMKELDQ